MLHGRKEGVFLYVVVGMTVLLHAAVVGCMNAFPDREQENVESNN